MESSVRLCLKFVLFSGLVALAYAYPKKTDLAESYRNQHLPEIPGYIPVYIKPEQPLTTFKSQPLKTTKPKNKPQAMKNKEDHGKRTTIDYVPQKPVEPQQRPLKPQQHSTKPPVQKA